MDYAARRQANSTLFRGLIMRELRIAAVDLSQDIRDHIDTLLKWEHEDQEDFLAALEETVYVLVRAADKDLSRYSLASLAAEVKRTAEIIGRVAEVPAPSLTLTEEQEAAFAQNVADVEARQAEREISCEPGCPLCEPTPMDVLTDPRENGYTIADLCDPEPAADTIPDFWTRFDVIKAVECAQADLAEYDFEAVVDTLTRFDAFSERDARRIASRAQRILQSEEKAKFTVEVLASHNLKPLGPTPDEVAEGEAGEETQEETVAPPSGPKRGRPGRPRK